MDLGVKIEAHLSKNGCPFIPIISAGYARCYIELNASNKLECWLAEGYNVKLEIMKGKDDGYFKTLMDHYPYPALWLEGLTMEYGPDSLNFHVHVRVWIHYGYKVSYDNYIRMVGNMFVEARKNWYNYVHVCSYSPDGSHDYDW